MLSIHTTPIKLPFDAICIARCYKVEEDLGRGSYGESHELASG